MPVTAVSGPRLIGLVVVMGALGASIGTRHLDTVPSSERTPTASTPDPSASLLERRQRAVSRSAERIPARVETAVAMQPLAARRSRTLARLNRQALERAQALDAQRWVLPVTTYHLTGTFGQRSYLWSTVHTGLDFAAPTGTSILAVASGTVDEAGWAGAYGYRTIVTLADGTEIWYCHQSQISVRAGQSVMRGQRIGTVGSTGNVTGPHLHLEVRPGGGEPVDPQIALPQHGVQP